MSAHKTRIRQQNCLTIYEATMSTDKSKVEQYFEHVVHKYNCGDIRQLLDLKLKQAGPLLACTVNGIDTVGGMMLGFKKGSRERSTEFMHRFLGLSPEESDLVYKLVRCGLAHEGISKLSVRFFVWYERVEPGTLLYKGGDNSIWLNVTELAESYLAAVEEIGKDIHKHLGYSPEPDAAEKETYQKALGIVTADIEYFPIDFDDPDMKGSSGSPFYAEWLCHFSVDPTPRSRCIIR